MPNLYVIAGHGAGDSGATGNCYTEAERVRALAKRMGELGGGEVVVLDTSRNWFADRGILSLGLPPGSEIVELHMDSGPRGARGGHVIVRPGKSPDGYDIALAALLSGMFPGRAESIRSQSLANATRAAQKGYGYRLLECGFISDAIDVETFNSHVDQLALGIMAAFGITHGKPTIKEDGDLKPISIPTGTYPVYRLYNPNAGDHHYTSSAKERDDLVKAGWKYECVGWHGADTGAVVYRLYNPNAGDHMFIADFEDARKLEEAGWKYEGANFAGARSGAPVYRLYNPNDGDHLFTIDAEERDNLEHAGWEYEGVAFHAAC